MVRMTIPLPPVTKKNHQEIWRNGKTGKPFAVPSSQYREYEKAASLFLRPLNIDYPVNVKAVYYMPTRRRVDLINLHSALHDVLVKAGVVTDDNCKIIVSTDGSRVDYDKDNPRTEIEIRRAQSEEI